MKAKRLWHLYVFSLLSVDPVEPQKECLLQEQLFRSYSTLECKNSWFLQVSRDEASHNAGHVLFCRKEALEQ